jgi:hypothetical protein
VRISYDYNEMMNLDYRIRMNEFILFFLLRTLPAKGFKILYIEILEKLDIKIAEFLIKVSR